MSNLDISCNLANLPVLPGSHAVLKCSIGGCFGTVVQGKKRLPALLSAQVS